MTFGFYGPIAGGVGTGVLYLIALVAVLHVANDDTIAANSRAAGSDALELAPAHRRPAGVDALTEPSPV